MTHVPRDHDHDDAEPVTDRVREQSWSANLETVEHGRNRDLVVEHARTAVVHTAPGNHVDLVTHGAHGHPETYLAAVLEEIDPLQRIPALRIDWEYVEQCDCGGHVLRVYVE